MPAPQSWMPASMSDAEKDAHATANPGDPHGAAADAWEDYAAQLTTSALDAASSVQTGSQSISYDGSGGASAAGQAQNRANWHRARARLVSRKVGPDHQYDSLSAGVQRAGDANTGSSDPEVYTGDDGSVTLWPNAGREVK